MSIPNDWKVRSLSEICSGKLQTGPFGSQLHSHEYVESGVAVLMPKDLDSCRADLNSAAKITRDKAESLSKHYLKSGDLLFSRRGDVARFALIDGNSEGAICGTGCLKATPNKNHSPEFLSYFLQLHSVKRWLEQNAVGQTMPNMNTEILGQLPLLSAASFSEEEKIAQILSTWDEAIATTEKLLANSQQQKKALMQQLLTGKKRLKNQNGQRFSGEWEEKTLSQVFDRVTEKNNGQSETVVTISAQRGFVRQDEFFKKQVASATLDGYFVLRKGEFAYNKSYSNGYPMGAIKRLNDFNDAVVTTLYICFSLKPSTISNGDYWEHYFESGLLNRGLMQVAHEGGRAHGLLNVKPADFFSLKISVPSLAEQNAIAAVLNSAASDLSALLATLSNLKLQKQALMQQLLTGKRRVKV